MITYTVDDYKANAIDRLCVEAGINCADVYQLDVRRFWLIFYTYRVNKVGLRYTYSNGRLATRRYWRWIK